MNVLLLLDRASDSIFDSREAVELFEELENKGYRLQRPELISS